MPASVVAVLALAIPILASLASSASAATWSIQTTPNATGAEHSALYDISCEPSGTSVCFSVGKQTVSGGNSSPYAQIWNGSSWSNQTVPAVEGATAGELQSIDCFAAELCFTAGSYTKSGVTTGLVESQAAGFWKIQTTPSPEGSTESAFKGMSCRISLPACFAVGYSVKSGVKQVFAIGLSSESKWVIQTIPVPEGAISSELHGVDCTSTSFCVAVGSYTVSGGAQWAMSATWNGTSWTSRTVAKPSESKGSILLDVSCSSSSSCRGVGGYRNSSNVQVSFAESWNGSAWSHQSTPNPIGSTNTVFQGVSCNAGPCVAVGDWNNGKVWQPMAQEWNGSAWALDTTPTPEGATFSLLENVACRTGVCLASGWYTDSGGKNRTLGEKR
jgi:hypothetical protein